MPRLANGIFANSEDDGTISFCDMGQRGDRTAFMFAKTMLLNVHLTVIQSYGCQATAFPRPWSSNCLRLMEIPGISPGSKQQEQRPRGTWSPSLRVPSGPPPMKKIYNYMDLRWSSNNLMAIQLNVRWGPDLELPSKRRSLLQDLKIINIMS